MEVLSAIQVIAPNGSYWPITVRCWLHKVLARDRSLRAVIDLQGTVDTRTLNGYFRWQIDRSDSTNRALIR